MNHQWRTLITAFLFIVTPAFLYAQAPSNDNCAGAITLTSGNTCNSATYNIRNATSSTTAGACGGATSTTTYDVWFKFQAVNGTTTITLSNLGSQFNKLGSYIPYLEVLSASSCSGPFTSLGCQAISTAPSRLTVTGLTVATFYYVRIYVLSSPTASGNGKWDFDICVQHQPANDDCTGAVPLTPAAACSNIAGTLDLATANASGINTSCSMAGTSKDVWYKFTASATTNYTVTLSNLGANITSPGIQIYSGACGSLTYLSCVNGTALTRAVTNTVTYYVRISNSAGADPSGTGNVANFNICLTTSSTVPPVNDGCAGAISLTSSTSCISISGTLINATATGSSSCGSIVASSADVWYSFVAQSAYPTIDVTESFPSGGQAGIEIYSVCGGSPLGTCAANTYNTATQYPTGLNVGSTYYVRVGINKSIGTPTSGAYGFTICITDPTSNVTVDYGKSYINVTTGKYWNGGTVDPGDTLEVRATFVVGGTGYVDSVAYYDTLRAGKGFALVPGTIALRTNEGKIYRADSPSKTAFTDAFDSDAGWRSFVGSDTAIQINMGTNSSNVKRGRIDNTSRPSNFGSTCIVLATYRVVVNGAYDTKINFGGGKFTYKNPTTGIFSSISFPSDSLIVYQSPGLCPNAISPTNVISDEYSGTFGTASSSASGNRNRSTSSNTNYVYQVFGPPTGGGGPNDYYYGIADNTSAVNPPIVTTTLAKPNSNRVFNVWDITGDHTGATNTARGNSPCDPSKAISSTNPCGYMMVVNSAYNTDTAFQYNVSGLCTNTYYEISAWFKNICYKCGCDSNGNNHPVVGYIPTGLGDTSGVKPNIAFDIDAINYYTTGNIQYQGLGGTQTGSDTLNNWVKRGFTLKTGSSQTSFVLTLRNNSPGGGGNDWAIDDIKLANCLPNMSYSPSMLPQVCDSNTIAIDDTIRSYFNTYADYIWQRSTDNGVTWTNIPGTQGTGTPVWNGSAYQYVASYTIPTSATNLADSGNLYRVVVGTTASNVLSPGCQNTDGVSLITLNVMNCSTPVKIGMLSFNGKLINSHTNLFWNTSTEDELVHFDIEKSSDGINFNRIGTVNSYANYISEINHYSFIDPVEFAGKALYRIAIINDRGEKKYSRTIQLTDEHIEFGLRNIVNPFRNDLSFEVVTTSNAKIDVSLIDMFGKTVKSKTYSVYSGVNSISIANTERLSSGIYIMQVKNKDITINNKVLKK